MQEYYDNTTYFSSLLQTCLETLWPSDDHHFQQRCHICQHILEDSLEIYRNETLLIDGFPSLHKLHTEVVNRLVVQLLCVYKNKHHRKWDDSIL